MSDNLFQMEAQEDTPYIKLETKGEKNFVFISGVSMPENAFEFYSPLFNKINDFFKSPSNVTLEIHLDYMNSMSNKLLFKLISDFHQKINEFNLVWKYAMNDDLMLAKGKEIQSIFPDLKIELIAL